ncbi:S8 family serine peptidase, partial [Euryarchaeota archaeon]|nr:S8 family serine peptidase [Euryarchaeota archaeon]
MRPALFITMLMLLPLVQGLSPTVPSSNEEGAEYILELEDGVWSQERWDSLASTGHTPLRMVSPNQVLVWRSPDFTSLSDVLTQEAPDTEYKWGFGPHVEYVKVVFEPRLPADAVSSLVQGFQAFGIDIESDPHKYSQALPHIEIIDWSNFAHTPVFENIDGVLWVEPVVSTEGRNVLAGSLLQHGKTTGSPAWELGINGDGVVVAAADSGIDYDHACFRNATSPGAVGSNGTDGVGSPGVEHRKILTVNHTLDSGDTNGHSDYRHGTHVAGTLTCYNVYDMRADSKPKNGSALAYQSKLVFQDIVSSDG